MLSVGNKSIMKKGLIKRIIRRRLVLNLWSLVVIFEFLDVLCWDNILLLANPMGLNIQRAHGL